MSPVDSLLCMCARTSLKITPEDLRQTFGYPVPASYRPRYNIPPTQPLLTIGDTGNGRGFHMLRWGLIPWWAEDPSVGNRMINARAETVLQKSAFREAFGSRRCLVVVDGFYEWQPGPSGKRPYRVHTQSDQAFTLAGLWDRWSRGEEVIESCTILTSAPNEVIAPLHDRMPVIIAPEDRERWLAPEGEPSELRDLLVPYNGNDLEAYEVSPVVNSPDYDRPDCLVPSPMLSLFD